MPTIAAFLMSCRHAFSQPTHVSKAATAAAMASRQGLSRGNHPLKCSRASEDPAAGTDADGLFAALRFAAPVIPPMVRAPYSNLFPDVLVLGPRVLREGYGGVLLAGYFGSRWELDEVASFAV